MSVFTLAQVMALFWTLAEGLILIGLGRVLFLIGGKRKRSPVCDAGGVLGFVLAFLILFHGESLLGGILDLQRAPCLTFYRWALWNFFCTLWVVLEGVIMIVVFRIFRILRFRESPAGPDSCRIPKGSSWTIPLLVLSLFGLYAFYQIQVARMMDADRLTVQGIYHLSLFYIRICGVFWILFEWTVALIGVRTFVLLKGRHGSSPWNR
ncbi:MAG: hypothetical protein JW821_18250 [Deltaproteobacteria bacterium]|nr:hypothetical protein [Deltaproteobacteria bacterium]